MNYRIVADSSSNILTMDNPHYFSVPMKVRAEKEYIDNEQLDVAQMVEELKHHKGQKEASLIPVASVRSTQSNPIKVLRKCQYVKLGENGLSLSLAWHLCPSASCL